MSRGPNHPPVKVKAAVFARDSGLCVLRLEGCSGRAETTDHRANRGAGGSRVLNDPANLVSTCVSCNGAKADASGAVREDLERRGINVLPASTHQKTLDRARETPVLYPDGVWYQLIGEHTRVPVVPTQQERYAH